MLELPIYNLQGKEEAKTKLPEEVFNAKDNPQLLSQAVRVFLFNQRQGNASVKTRGEVRGSTRKIYRQKGTGKARHGSIRAPIFVKGGIVFGPNPRDFSLKLPKKMKKQALHIALTTKAKEQAIYILEGLEKISPKTKEMVAVLTNLKLAPGKEKILLIIDHFQKNINLSGRNIPLLTIMPLYQLNTYEILNHDKLIITKPALLGMSVDEKDNTNKELSSKEVKKVPQKVKKIETLPEKPKKRIIKKPKRPLKVKTVKKG